MRKSAAAPHLIESSVLAVRNQTGKPVEAFISDEEKMSYEKRLHQSRLTWVVLVLAGLALFLGSCAPDPSSPFRNPKFRCPSRDVVEPGRGYPYPQSSDGKKSVRELKDFCATMDRRFNESNLTVEEAEHFYDLLKANNRTSLPGGQYLFFANGTYGMPGPEVPEPFIFEEQVRLKKLSSEKYEIFYYHVDCGLNYTHMEFYLKDGVLVGYGYLDTWQENFPC
jgi:hypothetical protein